MIDWSEVKSVLIVKLRSIGDTVLSTPSLIALRRFLPKARIDILLEDWVAPILEGFDQVDNVIVLKKSLKSKLRTALEIRKRRYDVAFNLHGGTTATFFIAASQAKHRVAYKHVRYNFLYNHLLSSASDFWQQPTTHSTEQQLALLGFVGVNVRDKPKSHLKVSKDAEKTLIEKLEKFQSFDRTRKIALLHPGATLETKRWSEQRFALIADFLYQKGFMPIATGTKNELEILTKLKKAAKKTVLVCTDLSLPEVTALASKASIFVGNDSGIAHIAAAVQTPCVVIFGSSNVNHWRPWTDAPNRIVIKPMPCQPCHGYFCAEFDRPRCILEVSVESVIEAIEQVIEESSQKTTLSAR
ncbi:MAG: glycosyltransferase family 9 protein [Pyrinomonadaceae bacterium]|nr:glycosyltransferase family 9 protein [Pyrinomonadaceae bacterium]MCX7640191.1 glycosyltransferase family 9 protein [Pyrinomonadaceae bacterium]MDW8303221.1 glycosyltransferase family 9 protein [Acidobacteriota bacterium]